MEQPRRTIATFPTDTGDLPLVLDHEERAHHLYLVGRSGSGKTTLMANLIAGDLDEGFGVGLVDPHGDLAALIADSIPRGRTEQVAYLDVTDPTHVVGFNPLSQVPRERMSVAAEEMIAAFKAVWTDAWGARLEEQLRYGLLTLLELGTATLADLPRLFRDEAFQAKSRSRISDPMTLRYWQDEWDNYDKGQKAEYPVSLLNKVRAFLSSPTTRGILCQRHPRFDLRTTMDTGGVFIANLAKGKIGAGQSSILGALLVSYVNSVAMQRIDQPAHLRRPFRLHVDEAQNVATSAIESLLSESRKFAVQLTLANQTLAQLTREVQSAIFTNAGTITAFRVSERDAEALAPELAVDTTALSGQLPHHAVIRRGHHVKPIETLPFHPQTTNRFEAVRAASRMRFARKRSDVEGWL